MKKGLMPQGGRGAVAWELQSQLDEYEMERDDTTRPR